MTRSIRLALALATVLVTFAVPSLASAATVEECQAAITTLSVQTQDAEFFGRQAAKEEAGLVAKLAGASQALAAGKNADAVKKLTDFALHAGTIANAGKLDPTDGAALVEGANEAIACINAIGA